MEEYINITSELDAREILRYLNYLGIHNISGEVLKYFITDLKKLIKYDIEQRSQYNGKSEKHEGPERLHSASTFSSRSRSKVFSREVLCCTKECLRKATSIRNVHSAPTLRKTMDESPPKRRACSCVRVEQKSERGKESTRAPNTLCENLIKVPRLRQKKKCDPVSLYHYYSSLWEKYKPNVPGENDWADIRWRIRQKMVGTDSQPPSKVSLHKNQGRGKS
ncbi:unnamed protein product [Leptosia nina]|uniref:Centriolar and ciliogenesis-associated protein HYLS1 C-terminal domain-containing protein n=1 Tax=Leptosia nina TaxID=320188 RepID=A0AAV1JLZ2_9NEOP